MSPGGHLKACWQIEDTVTTITLLRFVGLGTKRIRWSVIVFKTNFPESPFYYRFAIPASPSQVFTRLFTGFQRTSRPLGGSPRANGPADAMAAHLPRARTFGAKSQPGASARPLSCARTFGAKHNRGLPPVRSSTQSGDASWRLKSCGCENARDGDSGSPQLSSLEFLFKNLHRRTGFLSAELAAFGLIIVFDRHDLQES
jgi:hypothetical protein